MQLESVDSEICTSEFESDIKVKRVHTILCYRSVRAESGHESETEMIQQTKFLLSRKQQYKI